MAPSFDCAVSSLLCAEDNNGIFDDNDCYGALVEEYEATWHRKNHRIHHQDRAYCGGGNEAEEGDLDLGSRKEAIDWIGKVHAHFGFGPLCAYLSINYLDRFLSAYELPKGKAWMMQLLAVACLSLAAKMEETEVPLSLDLQVGESKFVFEARTIQRMELLVLSTLSWRMQAITPFSFIDHFLNKINNDETQLSLILQSIQLISSTIKGIDFLEFRPSEIAAAVAIAVVGEIKTVDAEQAISALAQHVEKERVLKCIQLIHDMLLIGGTVKDASASILSVPQSPIGVLDAACLSYRSDDTTVGSCANSSQNTPDAKRRRLNRPWEV
ncbi:hypothetical protein GH714_026256 [Hevea brasiliensis]|uniref:B-like cyclin n=1 Tax=Hevea brasiliensis TaxID=3981 RepID=A0A6A6LE30_HEVBR|nr:hypothetical protein GH714_026256 [Hevea brasiliensis]